jgi:hypothetical protein
VLNDTVAYQMLSLFVFSSLLHSLAPFPFLSLAGGDKAAAAAGSTFLCA